MRRVITSMMKPSVVEDEFFSSVVLLLDFAGNDGDTDTTDLSNSAHVDTFVQQAEIDTAIQALGNNTVLLDGTGDSVTFPDNVDWNLSTGSFTLECHFQSSDDAHNGALLSNYNAPFGWSVQHLSGAALRLLNGDTQIKSETWDPTEGQMYHVAVTRGGSPSGVRYWIDGVELGTVTADSTDLSGSANPLVVGGLLASTQNVQGNIGAVRITKGVERYTSNFTPPTVFYPTSGPPVPEPPTDPDFSSVVLLLDFAGADGATDITDLSDSAHSETFINSAEVDDDLQYLNTNTLLLPPATGSRMDFPDSADWDFGTSDFTVECGVRFSADVTSRQAFISHYDGANGGFWVQHFEPGAGSPNNPRLRVGEGDNVLFATVPSDNYAPTTGIFYHIAVSRSGTDLRVFFDGTQLGSTVTDSTNITGSTDVLELAGLAGSGGLVGNLGAVRITKGVARYTENFTAPTVFYPTS